MGTVCQTPVYTANQLGRYLSRMDRISVFVILCSVYHTCHGSIVGGLPYGPPPQDCVNVTLAITSTMFVTTTEHLPAITNTRFIGPDTSFKPMPQRTSTVTTSVQKVLDPITVFKTLIIPKHCYTKLENATVTQTIPVFVTTYLPPITITKQSKMMVWMPVPPIIKTDVVTSNKKEDPKLKIMVRTSVTNVTEISNVITMTMPITYTTFLPALTSTVHDYAVQTTTLPAVTTTFPPEVIMNNASTVTSTVLITHTEEVAPDTKLVTWTITQTISKCTSAYHYHPPGPVRDDKGPTNTTVPFEALPTQAPTGAFPPPAPIAQTLKPRQV